MKSTALWVFVALSVSYAGLCLYLYAVQRALIYFPVGGSQNDAAHDLRILSDGESLQVWQRTAGQSSALIYFGGNAEDVTGNLSVFTGLFPDRAIYLVNYRGYGASTGSPTEDALYVDALSVYDHVRIEHDNVSVIGRSLGSGVATYLATQRPVERLVLVTPFDSLANVAQSAYRFVPVSLLLHDTYDSVGRAPRITAPTLILTAARDEIIPASSSQALADGFDPAHLRLIVIDNAGHNTIDEFPAYVEALAGFFQVRQLHDPWNEAQ